MQKSGNMDVERYNEKMKLLYDNLINYLSDIINSDYILQNFMKIFEEQNIRSDQQELESFLIMLLKICNNYQRNQFFSPKIDAILSLLQNDIKSNFSNSKIFKFFQSNKLILYFLIKKNIITVDDSISSIMTNDVNKAKNYDHYFIKEIKQIDVDDNEDFERKRYEGENDSFICQLIRNDDIDEFIPYLHQNNISVNSQVINSIFETNSFLLKQKDTTLIEYAAFFGSIRIFQYLYTNGAELKPSLWFYSIHGGNAEIIQSLEDKKSETKDDKLYLNCFKESIKCHNVNFADFFKNNFLSDEDLIKFDKSATAYGLKYRNYNFIPTDLTNYEFNFFYFCEYNEMKLVQLFLKNNLFDLNKQIIQKILFFK